MASRVVLVPEAGVSAAPSLTSGGSRLRPGWHAGASAVVLGADPVGLRVGLAREQLDRRWAGGYWLVDVGIVRAVRPRR